MDQSCEAHVAARAREARRDGLFGPVLASDLGQTSLWCPVHDDWVEPAWEDTALDERVAYAICPECTGRVIGTIPKVLPL